MRRGQNPAKFVAEVARPARLTVAVLTYAPFLGGFFAEALDVIRACLESLWRTTPAPYDLLVFDNGSCREVVDYLLEARRAGRIQHLMLSQHNLGKGGAWNMIFQGAPGELLAYTDCDALFFDGWLGRSLEILETFPRVGMVTARPFRTPEAFLTSTVAWAESTPEVRLERGQFIPWEVFREFDMSLGQEEQAIRARYDSTEDVRLTYYGVEAQVGASHYQFLARKSVLAEFVPFVMDRPMGQVRQLDQRMNDAGYLRLMTTEPLVMNMSNSTRPVPPPGGGGTPRRVGLARRLAEAAPVRQALMAVHDAIFRLYFGAGGGGSR
jgi:glycosyltransferase involved in cell wall biosynthesis